jgi:uncharacterized coiled-coil protein SlyX
VSTLEERAATLESNMAEQTRRVDDVREALKQFDGRVDRRFEAVDRRFDSMEHRLAGMDQKLDAHFVAIDSKMSRLQSLQVGTLLAVIAALAGMLSGITR